MTPSTSGTPPATTTTTPIRDAWHSQTVDARLPMTRPVSTKDAL